MPRHDTYCPPVYGFESLVAHIIERLRGLSTAWSLAWAAFTADAETCSVPQARAQRRLGDFLNRCARHIRHDSNLIRHFERREPASACLDNRPLQIAGRGNELAGIW